MDIESSKERCASLSKNPEDYLCEEEDAASLLKLGSSPLRKEPTIKELTGERASNSIGLF